MAIETVVVTVLDDEVVPSTVDGVTVLVYDATGTTFETSAVSGAVTPGEAMLMLEGGDPAIRYQLRFHMSGGSITSPQYIDVYSPPANSPTGANNFEITAALRTLPEATDPLLCRVSGYVRSPNGRLLKGLDIHWIPCFNPLVAGGDTVLGERVATRTDKNGYLCVDLYRNAYYAATVESHENILRDICIPDRSSAELSAILFPIVSSVVYSPAGPYALSVGDVLEVTPVVTSSNHCVLSGTGVADVAYSSSDTAVLSVTAGKDTVTLRALTAGTASLVAERRDLSVVYLPDPGIDGASTLVTVA